MKTLMYLTMTLNGYIADRNDECPWPKEVWKSYHKISKQYGAIIIGRKTYEIMRGLNEFDKIGNPFTIVLTKGARSRKRENTVFVKSAREAIKAAELNGYDRVLISGGGGANSSLMIEGLVDEIYIDIVPLIFGSGVRLFKEGDFNAKLRLNGIKMLSKQVMQLHYRVI